MKITKIRGCQSWVWPGGKYSDVAKAHTGTTLYTVMDNAPEDIVEIIREQQPISPIWVVDDGQTRIVYIQERDKLAWHYMEVVSRIVASRQ